MRVFEPNFFPYSDGAASLVIAKQVNGGKLMQVVYALSTDGGRLYLGDDKKTLMKEVVDRENQADGTNAREIAAARYAATGNLATAVKRMVSALPNDLSAPKAWPSSDSGTG